MAENSISLNTLFSTAKSNISQLEKLDPRSEDFDRSRTVAIQALEDSRDLITRLALYSPNETLEDVSSQDLQFLAVDYLLADLMLRSYGDNRLEQLKQASSLLESFLKRLEDYEILSNADRRLLERYQEDRKNFQLISTSNAEARRNAKVARFREEKELKSKLKLIRDESNKNRVDDETVRNLYLAELALFVHNSFQSLDMVSQELSMLSQMKHAVIPGVDEGEDDRRRRGQFAEGYSDRLDGPVTLGGLGRRGGPLLSPNGKPLQPFTLTDKRSQLQKGVFRPDHSLPTMSIDEYLEEEKKRGGMIEGGGNANAPQAEPDEDNMEAVDAATMKAREWDEFVEANPKGAGNTLNRG